jgi:hypothetical protein
MNVQTCTDFQQKKGFEMTNCCDDYGNCNQGRDCPIQVARIGQRMKSADPLPPSTWRQQIRYLAEWVLMGIVGVVWLTFLVACVYLYAT